MRTAIVFIALLSPALALAQWGVDVPRAGSWEMSIAAFQQNGSNVGGEGADPAASVSNSSSLKVDSDWGFGFGFNYNLTDRLSLGADLDWVRPRYEAKLVPDNAGQDEIYVKHHATLFSGRIKGTFNFSEKALSPFVNVGIGWTNFDSNVADGPPVTGCWWHPWWGYICENYYDTYSSTEFTYGTGVGLRYDLRGSGTIKASYNYWWLDNGGQSEDFTLDSFRLEYAWRF